MLAGIVRRRARGQRQVLTEVEGRGELGDGGLAVADAGERRLVDRQQPRRQRAATGRRVHGAGELRDRGVAEDVEIGGVGMVVERAGLPRRRQGIPASLETSQGFAVEHGGAGRV